MQRSTAPLVGTRSGCLTLIRLKKNQSQKRAIPRTSAYARSMRSRAAAAGATVVAELTCASSVPGISSAMMSRVFARLPELVNGNADLVRRGRFLTATFLVTSGETQYLVRVVEGRIARVERGPFL